MRKRIDQSENGWHLLVELVEIFLMV